jgi:hypothetical protein
MPRNKAFRLVQGSLALATAVGALVHVTGEHPATASMLPLTQRCGIAAKLIVLLHDLTTCCQPMSSAAEVLAAAAPLHTLLPLWHGIGAQMLMAMEAGAFVRLLCTVWFDHLHASCSKFGLRGLLTSGPRHARALSAYHSCVLLFESLTTLDCIFVVADRPAALEASGPDWISAYVGLSSFIGRQPQFKRHATALAAAPHMQATAVRLLLRHLLPLLLDRSFTVMVSPHRNFTGSIVSGEDMRRSAQTRLTYALQASCLRQAFAAELAQPQGAFTALRLAAQSLASLPAWPDAPEPWDESRQFGADLLGTVAFVVAGLHTAATRGGGGGGRDSGLQAGAWEALAAVPALATMVQDVLTTGQSRAKLAPEGPGALDHACTIACNVLLLLLAAQPPKLPGPEYLAQARMA